MFLAEWYKFATSMKMPTRWPGWWVSWERFGARRGEIIGLPGLRKFARITNCSNYEFFGWSTFNLRHTDALGPETSLLFQGQLLGQLFVVLEILFAQVLHEPAALAAHLEQSPAGMLILRVLFEMAGQLLDLPGEQADLNRRGTGVFFVPADVHGNFSFDLFSQGHIGQTLTPFGKLC